MYWIVAMICEVRAYAKWHRFEVGSAIGIVLATIISLGMIFGS